MTNDVLRAVIDEAQEWCDAVDRGTSWDYWDHHFKAMKYKLLPAARQALEAPAPLSGHTKPNGERLSAPDLAHRFVGETYDYQPQDPMARYLRERFTEYIEIDRAMAGEIILSDDVVLSAAMNLYNACQKHEKAISAMFPNATVSTAPLSECVSDHGMVERVARAICRENCACIGEKACFDVEGAWPNPNCGPPNCHSLARASLSATGGDKT